MSPQTGQIHQINLIMIPSADQDRSVEFYENLGFTKRNDAPFADGERWVEVYPPDGAAGLALLPRHWPGPAGVPTGIIISTEDIDAAHQRLRAEGVDVDAEIARPGGGGVTIQLGDVKVTDPTPAMFWLRDPDGNSLLVIGTA